MRRAIKVKIWVHSNWITIVYHIVALPSSCVLSISSIGFLIVGNYSEGFKGLCIVFVPYLTLAVTLVPLLRVITNKLAKNAVYFDYGKLTYKGQTRYNCSLSLRYVKFKPTVRDIIDTFLDQYLCIVFPRLIISADSFYVVCFVSWIDIRRLKKMGFDIKDIKYV